MQFIYRPETRNALILVLVTASTAFVAFFDSQHKLLGVLAVRGA